MTNESRFTRFALILGALCAPALCGVVACAAPADTETTTLPTDDDPTDPDATASASSTSAKVPPSTPAQTAGPGDSDGGGGGGGKTAAPDAAADAAPNANNTPPVLPGCIGRSEVEPNNVTAERLGGEVCGTLAGGDVDRFSFSVKAGDRVALTFELSAAATFTLDGTGLHIVASGKTIGPITLRASKDELITFALSKAAASLAYHVVLKRL